MVIRHGLAFARGLKDGGVWPCSKHFPGHGDAAADSHLSLPTVAHDESRLRRVELEPFRAWAAADLGPVMTAHVIYPALDAETPATGSRRILTEILKEELRFKGVVLSDDLEMGAVGQFGGARDVAVRSIRAGVDGLLVCSDRDTRSQVREALVREATGDPAFEQKLVRAGRRLSTLGTTGFPGADPQWIGSDDHLAARAAISSRLGL